jgi:hypothetical protein
LPFTDAPSFAQSPRTVPEAFSQEASDRANTVTSPRVAAMAASPHAMAPEPAIARRSDT